MEIVQGRPRESAESDRTCRVNRADRVAGGFCVRFSHQRKLNIADSHSVLLCALHGDIQRILKVTTALRDETRTQEQQQILHWLRPDNYRSQQQDLFDQRVSRTGES